METKIIDGRYLAKIKLLELSQTILKKNLHLILAIIKVGNDSATEMYVKNKIKKAEEIGIKTRLFSYETNVTQEELTEKILSLNKSPEITGFFIQSPLPKHLNLEVLSNLIDPLKDVDGMTATNLGKLFQNSLHYLAPATALAIMDCLHSIPNISLLGMNAVVVGRSNILGKPVASLLLNQNCTVTIAHTKTQNLKEICRSADILVCGTGKKDLINLEFVKDGAILIDCGAPFAEINFDSVQHHASYITPVPGGVGPLTIANLLANVVKASLQ